MILSLCYFHLQIKKRLFTILSVLQENPKGWSVISWVAPLLPDTFKNLSVYTAGTDTPRCWLCDDSLGFTNICECTDFQLILEVGLELMNVTPRQSPLHLLKEVQASYPTVHTDPLFSLLRFPLEVNKTWLVWWNWFPRLGEILDRQKQKVYSIVWRESCLELFG